MRVLITGSSGLIGSEAVEYYDRLAELVVGVDNNLRATFFGQRGDTIWNLNRLKACTKHFRHCNLDIRDREGLFHLFRSEAFDLVVHCAA